jgi:hypothetical protein
MDFEILSSSEWKNHYSMQIVFEWEMILKKELGIQINTEDLFVIDDIYINKLNGIIQKVIRNSFLKLHIDSSFNYLLRKNEKNYYISYQMYVNKTVNHYIYQPNCIPIFIDCFGDMIEYIPLLCKKNPLVFVTDYEVYMILQKTSIAVKIRYIPLSISDFYFNQKMPEKKFDVIQMGRLNPILHTWMLEVVRKFPEIDYVYSSRNNDINSYVSTATGLLADKTDTRSEFMQLLGSSRISLVSSPGIDGGEARTGGFNPVTPRFYESAVNYCKLVGRFPDNPDFLYNNVASVCDRPANYEEFEAVILKMLSEPFILTQDYKLFLESHLTSTTAQAIREALRIL